MADATTPSYDNYVPQAKLPRNNVYLGCSLLSFIAGVAVIAYALVVAPVGQEDTSIFELLGEEKYKFLVPAQILYVALGASLVCIGVMFYYFMNVEMNPAGTDKMQEIASAIESGANAFMKEEFKYTFVFLVVIFLAILLGLQDTKMAISYMIGGVLSGLTGYIGMRVAVKGNVRTTEAAQVSLGNALQVAFRSGAVMGLSVVAFGLFGLSSCYLLFGSVRALAGFGAGSSSIALFARVGGGIFTKAADVGADLVGKVESNIPEDDPRNPATIADNVGDNVGDVAGMGSDLFESYVGSIVAAAVLGAQANLSTGPANGVAIPFYIATVGVFVGCVCTFYVQPAETMSGLLASMSRNVYLAGIMIVVAVYAILTSLVPAESTKLLVCVCSGLVSGILIGKITEYYTSHEHTPTRQIARSAEFGAGPVIIEGLGQGMMSCTVPMILVVIAILVAYDQGQFYGTALASVGMLSTLGVTMATDAYGPVADNAGGIAEMAQLPEIVRERTDLLDALGNTTAATGKGFANGSAVLSAMSLLAAFTIEAKLDNSVNLLNPWVISGILIGALLPYIFGAYTMLAVGRAARAMIVEVRRQFKEMPDLKIDPEVLRAQGKPVPKADHDRCVAISTQSSLREMLLPGILAVFTPITIGFLFGSKGLTGLLVGAIASGYLMAVMMSNAGGAWDNAKKYVEAGLLKKDDGTVMGKGTDWHAAAVSGDTVGDPFKDTSGPALNILIKLMTRFSFVFATMFPIDPVWGSKEMWIGVAIGALGLFLAVIVILFVQPKEIKMESSSDAAPAKEQVNIEITDVPSNGNSTTVQ